MSRYIDADALITQDWFVEYIGNLEETQVKDIIQQCKWYVMKAPSIDIVRCKECRWYKKWKTIGRDDGYCEYARMTQDGLQYINTNLDDFCSYGEREGE